MTRQETLPLYALIRPKSLPFLPMRNQSQLAYHRCETRKIGWRKSHIARGRLRYNISYIICTWFMLCEIFVVIYVSIVSLIISISGYFNGTGATIYYPNATEATLKNVGKSFIWIHKELWYNRKNKKKTQQCTLLVEPMMKSRQNHDGVMIWKNIQCYWLCVKDQALVNPPHKGPTLLTVELSCFLCSFLPEKLSVLDMAVAPGTLMPTRSNCDIIFITDSVSGALMPMRSNCGVIFITDSVSGALMPMSSNCDVSFITDSVLGALMPMHSNCDVILSQTASQNSRTAWQSKNRERNEGRVSKYENGLNSSDAGDGIFFKSLSSDKREELDNSFSGCKADVMHYHSEMMVMGTRYQRENKTAEEKHQKQIEEMAEQNKSLIAYNEKMYEKCQRIVKEMQADHDEKREDIMKELWSQLEERDDRHWRMMPRMRAEWSWRTQVTNNDTWRT